MNAEIYESTLELINNCLDAKSISTTDISKQFNIEREYMVDFRNNDIKDAALLKKLYLYLFPGDDDKMLNLLNDSIDNCKSIKQMVALYNNHETIKDNLILDKEYHLYDIFDDLKRQIIAETAANYLKEMEGSIICQK